MSVCQPHADIIFYTHCFFVGNVKFCHQFDILHHLAWIVTSAQKKILFNLKNLMYMSEVKIRPLQDRVLVQAAPAEEKTAGGIIIPDTAKEKPQRGTIVAVGNGKKDEPLTVKVGDQVLYGKYAGTEISVEGKDYLIMRESDIFAIL